MNIYQIHANKPKNVVDEVTSMIVAAESERWARHWAAQKHGTEGMHVWQDCLQSTATIIYRTTDDEAVLQVTKLDANMNVLASLA